MDCIKDGDRELIGRFISGEEDAEAFFENNEVSVGFLYECYQSGDRGLQDTVLNYIEGERDASVIAKECPLLAESMIDRVEEFTLISWFEAFRELGMYPQAYKCLRAILDFHIIEDRDVGNSRFDGDDNCVIALKYLSEHLREGKGVEKNEPLARYCEEKARLIERFPDKNILL